MKTVYLRNKQTVLEKKNSNYHRYGSFYTWWIHFLLNSHWNTKLLKTFNIFKFPIIPRILVKGYLVSSTDKFVCVRSNTKYEIPFILHMQRPDARLTWTEISAWSSQIDEIPQHEISYTAQFFYWTVVLFAGQEAFLGWFSCCYCNHVLARIK